MVIEDARPEDWPRLERIYRDARLASFGWLEPGRVKTGSLAKDAEGELVYVAREEDGCATGFVSVWAPENFVHHLYVAPEWMGRGAGGALLDFAAKRHPGVLRLRCVEQNHAARGFYRRRGWREIGEGSSPDGPYLLLESPDSEVAPRPRSRE